MKENQKPLATIENLNVCISLKKKLDDYKGNDMEIMNTMLNEYQNYRNQFDWFCQEFEQDGMKGVKDVFGNVLIPAEYEAVYNLPDYDFINVLPLFVERNGLLAIVVIRNGKPVQTTDFAYDRAYNVEFSGYSAVHSPQTGKWGLACDNNGNLVVPAEMDRVDSITMNGNIFVYKDGKEGVFDYIQGNFAYPEYDSVDGMGSGGYLIFQKDGVEGQVDEKGRFWEKSYIDRYYNEEVPDFEGHYISAPEAEEPEFFQDYI